MSGLCKSTEPVTANEVKSETLWNNRFITIDLLDKVELSIVTLK